MFRLVVTRIISTGRIQIKSSECLSSSSRHFLRNSTSQSNERPVISTTTSIDKNKSEESSQTNKSVSLPKIYTRRGDRGTSALLSSGPNRLSKDSIIFDVLGTIDELSATIGIVISTCPFPTISKQLENIQCSLFEIGACVAAENRSTRFVFNDSTLIKDLEEEIDKMTDELPPLRNFILPGGSSKTSSSLHFSRAVCRRCERLLTKWLNNQTKEQQETVMGIYLNRLSDYLFTLGRYIAFKEGHKEILYRKSK
ncbi:unnamed protein product [Rotaria sordida]|uniref:Corrinoid adenosyltransferase MMAB n=1 Tax=Rotaria sordida TaxID=392033 RepID=A0A819TF51_9BILA|nr:unnamed protein product [Rotaria sordida]CAF1360964.1 unnamed protein product [Rotaria sordida]CAF3790768.1 unnamed protein product [Rotaria sordida]CAF4064661.1 unnamed protein product [Rotaria sordida]